MISIEQLNIFLPYSLLMQGKNSGEICELKYISTSPSIKMSNRQYFEDINDFKPLVRPLSQLLDFPELIEFILEKREFEEWFIDEWKNNLFINKNGEVCINSHSPNDDCVLIGYDIELLFFWEVIFLAKNHFDLFNWLGDDLAELKL